MLLKKPLFIWNELKATFWFVPVLIISLSIFLAIGFIYLDQNITFPTNGLWRFFFVGSVDSARSILTIISGSMIGVAGTVFSVTLVALTLASSQLGPRLIKNFMYVRLNQVVLGSYIATFLYCLIVLNAVQGTDSFTFIPAFSILAAILVAIANIILLIVFIHNIAISIQADNVISDISLFILNKVKTMFPEKFEVKQHANMEAPVYLLKSEYKNETPLKSPKSGYLQYIDKDTLLQEALEIDALMEIHYRSGDYIVEGVEIGTCYTKEKLIDKRIQKLQNQFVVGKTKTTQQDLEFPIQQLVEIAARALSPGVNDPYTAIACIDNLTSALCYLVQAKFPDKYLLDDKNKPRIILDHLDFEGVLDTSFNQIRQFSKGSTAVIIRLMEVLAIIDSFAIKEDHKKAIIKHAKMTLNVGRDSIKEKNDLEALIERSKKILME